MSPRWLFYHLTATTDFIRRDPGFRDLAYTFKHALTQEVAYNSILIGRRKMLHERIGAAIEVLYPNRLEDHLGELAHHYSRTDNAEKAVSYLLRAGIQASQRSAYSEANAYFERGLPIVHKTTDQYKQELALQLAIGEALSATRGQAAPEVERAYARARELCRLQSDGHAIFSATTGICWFYLARGELDTAQELGFELFSMAEHADDPFPKLLAASTLGSALLWSGDFTAAQHQLEHGVALYDKSRGSGGFVTDLGVMCESYAGVALCFLGYSDQALTRVQKSIQLAQDLNSAHSLAHAFIFSAFIHMLRRDELRVKEAVEAAIRIASEHELTYWLAMAAIGQGWVLAQQGQAREGVEEARKAVAGCLAVGAEINQPMLLAIIADACIGVGEHYLAIDLVAEALANIMKGRCYEPELWRLKGDLLLVLHGKDHPEVALCYQSAIRIACEHSARLFELRATMSYARFLTAQGRHNEALNMVAESYDRFTEGLDTRDLKEAKALLEELRAQCGRPQQG